jgi:conjugative transfer signal peptidase TraF
MPEGHRGRVVRPGGRTASRAILALCCLGLGLVGFISLGRPGPLIIYNASASAPIGFYRVLPADPIRRGDLILANIPESVRRLAADRGYLPANVHLVKRVAALDGNAVCARDRAVTIDGRPVGQQRVADGQGRPLPAWDGCRALGPGEFFLLMEGVPDSFDSRYFGPISTEAVIGRLVPLWVR